MGISVKTDENGCVEGVVIDYDRLKPATDAGDLAPFDEESNAPFYEHLYGAPVETIADRLVRSL